MSESYKECVKKASSRSDLSLCPRGYCTAKDKYKVYPSAYANGFAVKVCNGQQADADGKTKKESDTGAQKGGQMRVQKRGLSNDQVNGQKKNKSNKIGKLEGSRIINNRGNQGNQGKDVRMTKDKRLKQSGGKQNSLKRWFEEKWVNVCEKKKNGDYKPCGRQEATLKSKDYPYCRPLRKLEGTTVKSVGDLSKKKLEQMCKKKKSIKPGVNGKPTRVTLE